MEKDTLMIMNDNIKEVLSKRRSYTIFAVFTSTDKRYEDERRSLEDNIMSLHDEYYKLPKFNRTEILFVVCRVENAYSFVDYV